MRNWVILFLLLCAGCGDSDEAIKKKAHKAFEIKDYATALDLYIKLAKKGDSGAQSNLGLMYHRGWGVEKNGKEAVMWWSKAAEQGEVNALNNVANAYKYGRDGVPQDYFEAIKWYEKCVAHSACFVEFGDMYERSLGVQGNQMEAVRLYTMGANQEIKFPHNPLQMEVVSKADAEMHLARMYASGLGVQKNCTEAKRLMALAANSNTIISDIARRELGENFCFSEVGTVNY